MNISVLMAWIGDADIDASEGKSPKERPGPITRALREQIFSHAFLLSGKEKEKEEIFLNWLRFQKIGDVEIEIYRAKLTSPTNFGEIYENARAAIIKLGEVFRSKGLPTNPLPLTFHLSPGTPVMAAVWIFLAKTLYPAKLIVSSIPEQGVQTVSLPFEITFDYLPDLIRERKEGGFISAPPGFAKIIHRSKIMKELIADAYKVAPYDDISIIILGESGTGKELFANALHDESPRKGHPFIAVNCGAIPENLLESELFGYEKGAFTGALRQKKGFFEQAHGGTLFLDEIGEMATNLQVKLLRAIQEREIWRIGGEKPIPIDIRLITATNQNIYQKVSGGDFRKDLFYRIAVKVLELPPLSERKDDIPLLIDHFLEKKNREYHGKPGWKMKNFSSGARKILYRHDWPGNIRELENTITRAALSAQGEIIQEEDVQRSMLLRIQKEERGEGVLTRSLGNGFNLEDVLDEVAAHYIKRALMKPDVRGRKNKAAELLGFKSHQKLNYWIEKLKLKEDGL